LASSKGPGAVEHEIEALDGAIFRTSAAGRV
jgi:hypothetical protein